jgi:hypothetical protein
MSGFNTEMGDAVGHPLLVKPFTQDQLLTCVQRLLTTRVRDSPPSAGTPPPSHES